MARKFPVGVEPQGTGSDVRVWAPRASKVSLITKHGDTFELEREANGYFSKFVPSIKPLDLYLYALDDSTNPLPDPCSRFQPEGPSSWSQVVDPSTFKWQDSDWEGLSIEGQVFYELHVGTFTQEGTWRAAMDQLPYLKKLGVTCIECMPIADFPGKFNWGYDGVSLFAPTRNYGTPDDLRAFIDAAHQQGIGVILDVVYNHFGPDGNFITNFSDHFLSSENPTDWGDAINFDGEGSEGVREFYITNARYWIAEYHFDGFRFDATQNIIDTSPTHILTDIAKAVTAEAGSRKVLFLCENEPQDPNFVRSCSEGGLGLTSLWNDDFHHVARVALEGRCEAYLSDYRGSPQEFISALKWGYLYQGQYYAWQKKRRGSEAIDLPPFRFINYIQNHDQIANIGDGRRVQEFCSFSQLKAVTALMLLAPQPPLLFQGQEFNASTPFHYFGDHNEKLLQQMSKGRLKELSQFPFLSRESLAKTQAISSSDRFVASKLNHDEKKRENKAQMLAFYRDFLELRKTQPFLRSQTERSIEGAVLSEEVFVIRFFDKNRDDRLVVVNLGSTYLPLNLPEPLFGCRPHHKWEIVTSTEDVRYGGAGHSLLEFADNDPRLLGTNWYFPAHATLVLKSVPLSKQAKEREHEVHVLHEKRKKQFLKELNDD